MGLQVRLRTPYAQWHADVCRIVDEWLAAEIIIKYSKTIDLLFPPFGLVQNDSPFGKKKAEKFGLYDLNVYLCKALNLTIIQIADMTILTMVNYDINVYKCMAYKLELNQHN